MGLFEQNAALVFAAIAVISFVGGYLGAAMRDVSAKGKQRWISR